MTYINNYYIIKTIIIVLLHYYIDTLVFHKISYYLLLTLFLYVFTILECIIYIYIYIVHNKYYSGLILNNLKIVHKKMHKMDKIQM